VDKTISIEIDGKSVVFKKLTRRIRGRIEEEARRWNKQRYSDSLGMSGFDPDAILELLQQLDETVVDIDNEVIPFSRTNDGFAFILEKHLEDPEDAELLDDLADPGKLFLDLWCGLIVAKPVEVKESEGTGEPPLAGTPETFGPTNPGTPGTRL